MRFFLWSLGKNYAIALRESTTACLFSGNDEEKANFSNTATFLSFLERPEQSLFLDHRLVVVLPISQERSSWIPFRIWYDFREVLVEDRGHPEPKGILANSR